MKALEQLVVRTRTRLREGKARVGLPGRPARLLLRLDDLDTPGGLPAAGMKLTEWHDAVVRIVEWTGALPVTIVARAQHPLLSELVRFTHRLECPTTLRTTPEGMGAALADGLVDCGLDRVVLRLAQAEGEGSASARQDVRAAVAALGAARASRGAELDIVVEVPFEVESGAALQGLFDEARFAGADGVRAAAPWRGGPLGAGALDALTWLASQRGPFHRTSPDTFVVLRQMRGEGPGAPRTNGACPVGTLRVELRADGTIRSCPFKGEGVLLGDLAVPAWQALDAHRVAIRACDRACAHPDLMA